MRQGIFQLRRAPTPAEEKRVAATRDSGIDSRGNAGAGNRKPAVPSTLDGNDQGDALLDVSEVADYLRISRSAEQVVMGSRPLEERDLAVGGPYDKPVAGVRDVAFTPTRPFP